ncbi:MAG TPA: hypothetical protein VF493_14480 [Terriglobales bacterium]
MLRATAYGTTTGIISLRDNASTKLAIALSLPRRNQGKDKLRDVLQEEADPVSRAKRPILQIGGKCIALLNQLIQAAVKVPHSGTVARLRDDVAESR